MLGYFGPCWAMSGHSEQCWPFLAIFSHFFCHFDHFWPISANSEQCLPLWAVVGHFLPLWPISANFDQFRWLWAISGNFSHSGPDPPDTLQEGGRVAEEGKIRSQARATSTVWKKIKYITHTHKKWLIVGQLMDWSVSTGAAGTAEELQFDDHGGVVSTTVVCWTSPAAASLRCHWPSLPLGIAKSNNWIAVKSKPPPG